MNSIQFDDVKYKYPTSEENVIRGVNLNIEKGKLYALIGPNGSGKTTICNIIRGLIPHFHKGTIEGSVKIEGKDIQEWEMEDIARKVGFVFQNPFTQISGIKETVFNEIAFGLENLGVDVETIKRNVKEALKLLGIEYLQDKNPNELSGGQKQRVAFASILVMDPEILVIDEPTSQLDPKGTEEVFKIIELMKERGKTIILVEHKIELMAEFADRVIVFNEGKVVREGSAKEVLTDESILKYGITLPQYALLGHEMNKRNMSLPSVPITESEAVKSIYNWLNK